MEDASKSEWSKKVKKSLLITRGTMDRRKSSFSLFDRRRSSTASVTTSFFPGLRRSASSIDPANAATQRRRKSSARPPQPDADSAPGSGGVNGEKRAENGVGPRRWRSLARKVLGNVHEEDGEDIAKGTSSVKGPES